MLIKCFFYWRRFLEAPVNDRDRRLHRLFRRVAPAGKDSPVSGGSGRAPGGKGTRAVQQGPPGGVRTPGVPRQVQASFVRRSAGNSEPNPPISTGQRRSLSGTVAWPGFQNTGGHIDTFWAKKLSRSSLRVHVLSSLMLPTKLPTTQFLSGFAQIKTGPIQIESGGRPVPPWLRQ